VTRHGSRPSARSATSPHVNSGLDRTWAHASFMREVSSASSNWQAGPRMASRRRQLLRLSPSPCSSRPTRGEQWASQPAPGTERRTARCAGGAPPLLDWPRPRLPRLASSAKASHLSPRPPWPHQDAAVTPLEMAIPPTRLPMHTRPAPLRRSGRSPQLSCSPQPSWSSQQAVLAEQPRWHCCADVRVVSGARCLRHKGNSANRPAYR